MIAQIQHSFDRSGRLQTAEISARQPSERLVGLRIETGADGVARLLGDGCSLGLFSDAAAAARTLAFLTGGAS